MQRRDFLLLTAAVSLAPLAAQAAFVPYTPGLAEDAITRGDRIILVFSATWCSTCNRQERIMNELRAQNAAYDQRLTLIEVDWDTYGTSDLVRRFNVPRRSTIIALHGTRELGRTVAGTQVSEIRALFDAALSA